MSCWYIDRWPEAYIVAANRPCLTCMHFENNVLLLVNQLVLISRAKQDNNIRPLSQRDWITFTVVTVDPT